MAPKCLLKLCCGHVGLLRGLGVVAGVLGMAISGSLFAFNSYANAVKATYNLTQTEVELLASLANFGVGLGFPAGLIQERFGSIATLVVGTFIVCPVSVALWSSISTPKFYASNFYLLCVYFLLYGFGSVFSYIPSLAVNVNNFRKKDRGKIIAVCDSGFSGGPMVFAFLYGVLFTQGHIYDQQNQNLGGYFFMIAIVFAAVNSFGCIFLHQYPPEERDGLGQADEDEEEHEAGEEEPINYKSYPSEGYKYGNSDITGLALIKSPCFHLIVWPYVSCSGLQFMVQNNLGVYLKSFNLVQYTTALTVFSFAVGLVAKLAAGFSSDYVSSGFPRIGFLAIVNCMQSVALFGSMFWADNLGYLFFVTAMVGIANGFLWCLTPTMVSEHFGTKHFARNWGAMLIGNSIMGWICQLMFGALYSREITHSSSRDCIGLTCFTWSFSIAFVFSTISAALNIVLFVKIKRRISL